eukprot:762900-Hanusia_phi.AAC.1
MSMGMLKKYLYSDVVEIKAERRPVKVIYAEANKSHFDFTFSHVIQHSSTDLEKQLLYNSTWTQVEQISELIRMLESRRTALLNELQLDNSDLAAWGSVAMPSKSPSAAWNLQGCSPSRHLALNRCAVRAADGVTTCLHGPEALANLSTTRRYPLVDGKEQEHNKPEATCRHGAFKPVKMLQGQLIESSKDTGKKRSRSTFNPEHDCEVGISSSSSSSKRHESNLPGKIVLTAETACEIYSMRPSRSDDSKGEARAKSHSAEIARKYGVTAKTIRDIWNRSTWSKATRKLWTEEETRIYHHNKLTRHHKLLVQTIKEQ